MLIFAKIFATILAIVVILRAINDLRNKSESIFMTIVWILIWIGILTAAYFPDIFAIVIEKTGSGRTGLGTVLGMAIAFALFISYRIYVKAHRIERAMGKIAYFLALHESQIASKGKGKKK